MHIAADIEKLYSEAKTASGRNDGKGSYWMNGKSWTEQWATSLKSNGLKRRSEEMKWLDFLLKKWFDFLF